MGRRSKQTQWNSQLLVPPGMLGTLQALCSSSGGNGWCADYPCRHLTRQACGSLRPACGVIHLLSVPNTEKPSLGCPAPQRGGRVAAHGRRAPIRHALDCAAAARSVVSTPASSAPQLGTAAASHQYPWRLRGVPPPGRSAARPARRGPPSGSRPGRPEQEEEGKGWKQAGVKGQRRQQATSRQHTAQHGVL